CRHGPYPAGVQPTSDLQRIRSLSQYRHFEGGGESVKEAYEDLVLASMAEAGGSIGSVEDCQSAIYTLFQLDLELIAVAGALNGLRHAGRAEASGAGFHLVELEKRRLDETARASE